jgi:hypothetical protein
MSVLTMLVQRNTIAPSPQGDTVRCAVRAFRTSAWLTGTSQEFFDPISGEWSIPPIYTHVVKDIEALAQILALPKVETFDHPGGRSTALGELRMEAVKLFCVLFRCGYRLVTDALRRVRVLDSLLVSCTAAAAVACPYRPLTRKAGAVHCVSMEQHAARPR